MSRILDIRKVDLALQRAARKAVHGTREEKSGRFLPSGRPWDFLGATAEANFALSIRLIFPAILFIVLFSSFSRHHLANGFLIAISIVVGPLFYLFYYKIIHKHIIRPATNVLFGGLPTYEAAKGLLKESGIDGDAISAPLLQDTIARFLHAYRLRRNKVVTRSSWIHVAYMTVVMFAAFGIYADFDRSAHFSFFDASPLVLSAILILIAMWFDHRYGEREESEIIRQNSALFVGYVKEVLKSNNSVRSTQTHAVD